MPSAGAATPSNQRIFHEVRARKIAAQKIRLHLYRTSAVVQYGVCSRHYSAGILLKFRGVCLYLYRNILIFNCDTYLYSVPLEALSRFLTPGIRHRSASTAYDYAGVCPGCRCHGFLCAHSGKGAGLAALSRAASTTGYARPVPGPLSREQSTAANCGTALSITS